MCALRLCNLDGKVADSSCARMDQDFLTGLQLPGADQALPCGQAGQRQRSCLQMI
jgi:hypothetical protein